MYVCPATGFVWENGEVNVKFCFITFIAKLELAAGMKLKLEEVRFDRFSQFLLDCDFLEIRSRGDRKGSTNDLYVFVSLRAMDSFKGLDGVLPVSFELFTDFIGT